jgi:hypothetical protein
VTETGSRTRFHQFTGHYVQDRSGGLGVQESDILLGMREEDPPARKLTPEQRKAAARRAAQGCWAKERKAQNG